MCRFAWGPHLHEQLQRHPRPQNEPQLLPQRNRMVREKINFPCRFIVECALCTVCSCALYWATTLHTTELRCTYWAALHPTELLRCTLLSYRLQPTELRCTLLSYAAPCWATLHPSELRCTTRSYAAPYWATLHPSAICLDMLWHGDYCSARPFLFFRNPEGSMTYIF